MIQVQSPVEVSSESFRVRGQCSTCAVQMDHSCIILMLKVREPIGST